MEQKPSLGELELEVLKVIWDRQPCTVLAVAEVMAERRDLARTTVLTVMQRLHAKGVLKRRKRRGVYHFSATQQRDVTLSTLIGGFVEQVLDGSALPFVAYLAKAKGLSPEQSKALSDIVANMEDAPKEKSE